VGAYASAELAVMHHIHFAHLESFTIGIRARNNITGHSEGGQDTQKYPAVFIQSNLKSSGVEAGDDHAGLSARDGFSDQLDLNFVG
jgi:hypothetical protein